MRVMLDCKHKLQSFLDNKACRKWIDKSSIRLLIRTRNHRTISAVRVISSPDHTSKLPNEYNRNLFNSLPDTIRLTKFTWLRAIIGFYDVLHVHWPEALIYGTSTRSRFGKKILFALLIIRVKFSGVVGIWTVHNPAPHENPSSIDGILLNYWAKTVHYQIHLTRHTVGLPPPPREDNIIIAHGKYDVSVKESSDLRHSAYPTKLLYFGYVRPYKGIAELIDAFRDWPSEATLKIVGEPWSERYAQELLDASDLDGRITTDMRRLSQEELSEEIIESDAVILPYRTMVNSGAALLALSHNRPILVPLNEITKDLSEEVGQEWVFHYSKMSPGTLSTFAKQFEVTPVSARPNLSQREWGIIARSHSSLYERAVRSKE